MVLKEHQGVHYWNIVSNLKCVGKLRVDTRCWILCGFLNHDKNFEFYSNYNGKGQENLGQRHNIYDLIYFLE
jgi:hypothetical protein